MHFSIFDKTLLILTTFITFLGGWINNYEKESPAFAQKVAVYCPTANRNSKTSSLDYVEIPKSYFRHLYIYAYVLSLASLIYMNLVYFFNLDVCTNVRSFLKLFMGNQKPVSVTAALISMCMLVIQCSRRLHETLFLQVFAKATKMNICHFVLAIAHYTICIVAVVGASPLFCGSQNRKGILWFDFNTLLAMIPSIISFAWASYEQNQSNRILSSLRGDFGSRIVIKEEYGMPRGRLFSTVSSPHRLTEIIIYAALALMMRTKTYLFILLWIVCNQLQSSIGTHNWYKLMYKNYQTQYALIPKLI